MNRKIKGVISKALLFCLGVLLGSIAAEVLLRVTAPRSVEVLGRVRAPMYQADEEMGWKLKPNFRAIEENSDFLMEIRTSSQGFRDHAMESSATGHVFRILAVGDSFTFGFGVQEDEAYPELIEERLNREKLKGLRYEVINTAIPGYCLSQYALFIQERWSEFRPNAIVVGIDVNDHTDILEFPKYDVAEGYLITHKSIKNGAIEKGRSNTSSAILRLKVFVFEHSRLARFLARRAVDVRDAIRSGSNSEWKQALLAKKEKAWSQAFGCLDRITRIKNAHNIPVLILYIPHRSQVHPGIEGDRFVRHVLFSDMDQQLAKYCRKNNITYVNLLPVFIEEARKGSMLYYQVADAHWNKKGHELAAACVYERLIAEIIQQR